MSFLTWWTQRAGAISVFLLLALSYYVISREATYVPQNQQSPASETRPGQEQGANDTASTRESGAGIWAFVFAYYSFFVHVLVICFPIRACWATWQLTNTLKRSSPAAALEEWDLSRKVSVKPRGGSQSSQSSGSTLNGESRPNSPWSDDTIDADLDNYADSELPQDDCVIHAIIVPNYKEELDVLRETLDVLASHPRARTCYDVYLGMEEREAAGTTKALALVQQFVKKFRSIDFTTHPGDIPGESAGKGSNLAWAARKLSARYSMRQRPNVIVTGMDADSHLLPTYFSSIAAMHLAEPDTAQTTMYPAPIIFDRNAHEVIGLVRVADILWCAAGISGLYRGSAIAPPTSVYSVPLELVDRVGGWDGNSEAIGEDFHMYIKCFFALNGHLTTRIVPSPVSSTNVSGCGGGGIRGSVSDVRARYKQALRHLWGSLDSGFAIRKSVDMWKDRKRTMKAFRPLHRSYGDDAADLVAPDAAPATDGSVLEPVENGIFTEITHVLVEEPHLENTFYLYLRLFEAHFMPIHMTILIFASAAYMWVMDGKGDPNNLMWTFWCSKILRTVGCMMIGTFMILYERYHRVCVAMRQKEMTKAGLAEGMSFSYRSLRRNFVDYLCIPLVAPIYGTIPGLQAIMSHLWTTDLVYTVSKKAVRQRARSIDGAEIA